MTRLRRFASAHPAAVAVAFYAVLAAVLFRDSLFFGDALSSADSLYVSLPFTADTPPGLIPSNKVLSDVPFYFQPMLEIVRESWRAGRLPLWDPYVMSGAPLLGNAQSAPLSPLMLPVWLLPLPYGFAVAAALKVWLAGLGTWFLCRRLGLGQWAALAGGVAYALSGFTIVWLGHAHTNVTAFLPWALAAVTMLVAAPGLGPMLLLAVALGAALLGGHPESAMFVGLAVILAFLAHFAVARVTKRTCAYFLGGLVLALGLGAAATLSFLAAVGGSVDEAVRSVAGGRLPGSSLLTIAFPDYWGRPTGAEVPGPSNFNERTFYVGALTAVLAVIALSLPGVVKRFVPVIVVGLVGLLAATEATASGDLMQRLPLLEHSALARMNVLLGLSMSVLGAAGLQAIIDGRVDRRRRNLILGAALAIGLVALASAKVPWGDIGAVLEGLDPGSLQTADAGVLHASAVIRWLVLIGAFGLAWVAAGRYRRAARLIAPIVLLLVVVDLLSFADGYQPSIPRSQHFAPEPGSVAFLQRAQGSDRVTARYSALPPNTGMHWRLRDIRAKEHPKPADMTTLFTTFFNARQDPLAALGVAELEGPAHDLLSLMAVRYVLMGPDDPPPRDRGWKVAYRGRDAVVYENTRALPRAFVPPAVRSVAPGEAMGILGRPSFDPARVALVDGPTGRTISGVRGQAEIVRDDPQRVSIDATLSQDGVVVLSDSYSHGWKATVDGRDAEVLRTNAVYRSVKVPAGTHRIEWTYRPLGTLAGIVISGLALLVAAGLFVLVLVRRRRAPGAGAV